MYPSQSLRPLATNLLYFDACFAMGTVVSPLLASDGVREGM